MTPNKGAVNAQPMSQLRPEADNRLRAILLVPSHVARSHRPYLRPQSRMAPTIGPSSRPFAVRTYSARGGLNRIEAPLDDAILLKTPQTLR